jgi:UDP-glucuronate 4-epimerase
MPASFGPEDDFRGRRFVVTGAAGFIGSHVVDALLRRGAEVVGIDNFDDFYDSALKRGNVTWASTQPAYALVEGDIRDPRSLDEAFSPGAVSAVIHLAARAGVRPSIVNPQLYDSVNVGGTTAVLEQARRHGTKQIIFGSSSSVYGATSPVPFAEGSPADRPSSPYAATKRSGEIACYAYHHLYGMDITCLRFFTVYGPRQRPEMAIHRFTRLIDHGQTVDLYGDGDSRRDYTFVDDVVDGVMRALYRPNGYRIYNLGTTRTTRLRELVEMIAARLNAPLRVVPMPDQPGDVPITFADIELAARELGYHPSTPIETGLDRFVLWYRRTDGGRRVAADAIGPSLDGFQPSLVLGQ